MNWPPTTMATQHPDNASIPWWRSDAFIPTQDEIEELLIVFKNLTSTMLHRLCGERMDEEALKREVVEAGVIRRSLG